LSQVAEARNGGQIEILGGRFTNQIVLYIDECLEGVRRFMDSDFSDPLNIGSEEMVAINKLAETD
jgi:nucleoside-diphosphate-sugar epimerase